jgi:hypothetical protein
MSQTESVKTQSWLNGNLQCIDFDKCRGEAVAYYDNGKLRFQYPRFNGRFHGLCRNWYPDGQLQLEATYCDGQIEGARKEWYDNGKPEAETTFSSGVFHGPARRWYPNGALESEWIYVNGVYHGPYRKWYDDGYLKLEANYENERLHGTIKQYSYGGILECTVFYVRGVQVSKEIQELLEKDKITAKHILNIENAAIRRVCLEKLGYARFLAQVPHAVIEKDGDCELVMIDWLKREEPICLVKVKCPSTGAFYTLRVPPHMDTVKKAVAWTFGVKEDDYKPEVET